MDVVSHALWGRLLTRNRIHPWIAMAMAILPDLVAFIPQTNWNFSKGKWREDVDDESVTSDMPVAWEIYQWSHSLFIVVVLFFSAYVFLRYKKQHPNPAQLSWMFVLPWFFHILLDIPGHTIRFFPTPFLHPFSDLMVDGVRWSTWWFFIPQVLVLAGCWWYVKHNDHNIDAMAETAARA